MDEKKSNNVTKQDLKAAFVPGAAAEMNIPVGNENDGIKEPGKPVKKSKINKKYLAMVIGGIVGLAGGAACVLYTVLSPRAELGELNFPKIPSKETSEATYSSLTGEALTDASKKNAPIYCIQTPNGTDGARPQAGLNKAGVIFEAVAEAGITRFAAIYQDPTTAIIGPIRSLRIYYLQWDTPFDCTIVHAGGSGDALAAVASGGYKDLSEDYNYMYRGTYGSRRWNNLFTTSAALEQFSTDRGYTTSDAKGFTRMTPEENEHARVDALAVEKLDIVKPAEGNTSALNAATSAVALRFGGWASFNVNYSYDTTTNKYLRSYESGAAHEVYDCAAENLGERNPEDVCSLTQMAPDVVVAMVVQESRAADNYHEDITTVGSGDVYIFQNGTAVKGRWNKASVADQIKFTDADGGEIKLAPGQTIISAVPSYGSVEY